MICRAFTDRNTSASLAKSAGEGERSAHKCALRLCVCVRVCIGVQALCSASAFELMHVRMPALPRLSACVYEQAHI